MMNQAFHKGDVIKDRYEVLSLIGKGGIGTTYRVVDSVQNRVVVLKTLDLQEVKDWKEIELFEREISALKNIRHSRIPDYYDNFEVKWNEKTLYVLVMECINGKNLYQCVKEGSRFTTPEVKRILEKLLSILSYIHSLQPPVIHRDINPKNIIRLQGGEIFLVDFGAVGSLVADTVAASTSNTFVGTIGYMPPEQLYGKSLPGSDIYSLGVTMLFLLTGREPSSFHLKDMRLNYKPFVNLKGDFKHLIDNMIEPDLDKRIKSAKQALSLLKKEKKKGEKREKKKKEVMEELSSLSDVDRIIEEKQKKEEAKKKAAKEAVKQKNEREKKKEMKEIEKANLSPQRVFINKTDEGVIVTVHRSPFPPFLKNNFSGDLAVSIFIYLFSLCFLIPMTLGLMEEFEIVWINNIVDTAIILSVCFVLVNVIKMLYSILARMKTFHLLLTNKNNVLIYRKNPLKPVVMGRKEQLDVTLDNKANPPGGSGSSTKAWKRINFRILDHSFKDDGFKSQDADRVNQFCTKNKIKINKY